MAVPRRAATELRVLKPGAPEPRPPRADLYSSRPWDGLYVRVLVSSLVVTAPFFVLTALFNPGTSLVLGALLAVAVLLALSTWWIMRPLSALSRAAEAVESGDYSARAKPAGSAGSRRLATTFNMRVDRVDGDLTRARMEGNEKAAGASASADRIATAIVEQSQAGARATARVETVLRDCAAGAGAVPPGVAPP